MKARVRLSVSCLFLLSILGCSDFNDADIKYAGPDAKELYFYGDGDLSSSCEQALDRVKSVVDQHHGHYRNSGCEYNRINQATYGMIVVSGVEMREQEIYIQPEGKRSDEDVRQAVESCNDYYQKALKDLAQWADVVLTWPCRLDSRRDYYGHQDVKQGIIVFIPRSQ